MFDKKKDLPSETINEKGNVYRPTKGSSKVIIGEGVNIKGEITNAEEVQIDGTADIVLKTENIIGKQILWNRQKLITKMLKIVKFKNEMLWTVSYSSGNLVDSSLLVAIQNNS